MDFAKINYDIQKSTFKEELKDFNTLRRVEEIPDYKKVIKFKKYIRIFEELCQASWETNGDIKFTNKKFGELFGISERQASRVLNLFKKLGLISTLCVRGFNGGLRYNKHGDSQHKNLSRKRYWTIRVIRIHWVLARKSYVIRKNLGWKNDPRPFGDIDAAQEDQAKNPTKQRSKYLMYLDIANSVWLKTRARIPMKYKITKPRYGVNRKTGERFISNPAFYSKIGMIKDGYVWESFFDDMELELEYRNMIGADRNDPNIQRALKKYGYPLVFRKKRLSAIIKRERQVMV